MYEKRMCFQVITAKKCLWSWNYMTRYWGSATVRHFVMHWIYYTIPDLNHEAESFLYGLMFAQGILQTKYFICIIKTKQVEY
jgi:hypothetical protein